MAEEKQPYWVELESQECSHCGAGSFWSVVHLENGEEVAGSTSYSDKETAEDVADLQNAAYARGKAALEAELAEHRKESCTYGEAYSSWPEIETRIQPHEWDNMNISEQRNWTISQCASLSLELAEAKRRASEAAGILCENDVNVARMEPIDRLTAAIGRVQRAHNVLISDAAMSQEGGNG